MGREIYPLLREQVPLIDACIQKIIRLTGGFKAIADDPAFQPDLDEFSEEVRVGLSGRGLNAFLDCWLDSLLTYGSALGEAIVSENARGIAGIYVAPMKRVDIKCEGGARRYLINGPGDTVTLPDSESLLFSALNPTADEPFGVPLLKGLPALSSVLLGIYRSIGANFERVGNVRYAVTYKPSHDLGEQAFTRERAEQIAREWSKGMADARSGEVRDFVAVGDVSIKAIGADNQVLDTEIPVRQILEQLISKLGIPPFLLGLNWSTSERMSKQQADILTSELEYYRRLVAPAIKEICRRHLRLLGGDGGVTVEWQDIDLQDETEAALARLRNAQAKKLEIENTKEEQKVG